MVRKGSRVRVSFRASQGPAPAGLSCFRGGSRGLYRLITRGLSQREYLWGISTPTAGCGSRSNPALCSFGPGGTTMNQEDVNTLLGLIGILRSLSRGLAAIPAAVPSVGGLLLGRACFGS